MGNLGGGEILVILLVALIVLGPTRLPEAARQVGTAVREMRRMSGAFQRELREAINDPITETRAMIKGVDITAPKTPSNSDAASEPESSPPAGEPTSTADSPPPTVADSPEA